MNRGRGKGRKHWHRRLTIVASIVLTVVASALLANLIVNQPSVQTSEPRAAIVDQLSLTFPNRTFVQTATNILGHAGFVVDYYPGEVVTVEFYRNLATHGYRIVILRVHSSATRVEGTSAPVTLFTSEPYTTTKYPYEQATGQLKGVAFSIEDAQRKNGYFGVTPDFVSNSMKGRLQDASIILMGCEGIGNIKMAEAFAAKGAKDYVSWSDSVLASHTDVATTHLLEHYLRDREGLREAVSQTMSEVGPDPAYNSILEYYPAS